MGWFLFRFRRKINFPKKRLFQFYLLSIEDKSSFKIRRRFAKWNPRKKSTGDLFAITTTGWETLIFNIPEFDGRNNIYNTITFVLGYDISNQSEVNYYMDNIQFSNPIQILLTN